MQDGWAYSGAVVGLVGGLLDRLHNELADARLPATTGCIPALAAHLGRSLDAFPPCAACFRPRKNTLHALRPYLIWDRSYLEIS